MPSHHDIIVTLERGPWPRDGSRTRLLHMLEELPIVLALQLLMSKVPLASLAVIAAIAVLVYEVRGFFGRSATDTSLSATTSGAPRLPMTPQRPQAPAPEGADRVSVLRAETMSLSAPEAPSLPLAGTPPGAAPPLHRDMVTAAAHAEPPAPVITPPRERAQAGDGGIDGRLALAGAVVVGLALLWLVARAARRRGDE
jgi:hypothetical protein